MSALPDSIDKREKSNKYESKKDLLTKKHRDVPKHAKKEKKKQHRKKISSYTSHRRRELAQLKEGTIRQQHRKELINTSRYVSSSQKVARLCLHHHGALIAQSLKQYRKESGSPKKI